MTILTEKDLDALEATRPLNPTDERFIAAIKQLRAALAAARRGPDIYP